LVDEVGVVEGAERLVEVVPSHSVPVDIEFGEECLVEDGSHGFVAGCVEVAGVVEETEPGGDDLPPGVELVTVGVELPAQGGLFATDGVDLGSELGFGPALLGGQVEEIVLFPIQLL
jgi:hypothetical protein